MFAGKTTELLRRVKRYKMAGKRTLAIKFMADQRYSKTHIWTHDRQRIPARSCNRLCEVKDEWMKYDVIGIVEVQFFSDIVEFSDNATDLNKIVVISALNNDYRRDAWPNIASLIPKSENVRNL